MVAPNSTSYPTLAVIQARGIEGQGARTAVWLRSAAIADYYRSPTSLNGEAMNRTYADLSAAIGPTLANDVDEDLFANVMAAVDWCRDNAGKA